MAKSRDDFNFDDFDVDNFDYDSMGGDGMEMKDDRSPVTKVSTEFLSGVKESVVSPAALRNTLKKALPRGYGQAWSTLDTITGEGASLYHEIGKELKPAIKDFKRAARGAKPLFDPLIPKGINEKLDRLLAEKDEGQGQISPDDAQAAAITAELGAIFEHQQKAQEDSAVQAATKEAGDRARHQESASLMDAIARSTGRLAAYQDTVGIAFQRKSLELQYRQFFIAKDHLNVFKGYIEETTTQLRAIAKNTGLPDAVKVQSSELMSQVFKERLFGQMHENLSQNAAAYIRKTMQNVGTRVRDGARNFGDSLSSAAMGLESVTMMNELQKDMGGDQGFTGMGANMAGGGVGNWMGDKVGGWLRKKLLANEKAQRGSNKLLYATENIPGLVNKWKEDPYGEEPAWLKAIPGFIKNFVRDALPSLGGNTEVTKDRIQEATQPATWDQYSRKSLVEIIPGYLARILQSSERHRLNTEDVPLMRFDYAKSKFATGKSIAKDIYKKLGGKSDLEQLDEKTRKFIETIDPTNDRLTESQKMGLQLELLKRAQDPRKSAFVKEDFTEGYFEHLEGEDAQAVRELIGEYLSEEGDRTKSRQLALSMQYRDIGTAMPQMRELANMYAQTGNRDLLEAMGVIAQSGDRDYTSDGYMLGKFKDFVGTGSNYDDFVDQKYTDGRRVRPVGSGRRSNVSTNPDDLSDGFAAYTNPEMGARSTQTQQRFSDQGLTEQVDRLLGEIRASSSKAETADAAATLREILALLSEGDFGGGGGSGGAGPMGPNRPGRFKRATGWVGGKAKGFLTGLWNMGGKANSALWGGLGKVKDTALGGWGWLKDRKKAIDVHIKGQMEPVLTAEKMAAGDYIDALTGKTIESLKDIKGAVIDLKTNTTVLKIEDYRKGLFDGRGKELVKGKINWALDKLSPLAGMAMRGFKAPLDAFQWARRTLKDAFFRPKDVYVPGETSPRLYANLLLEGKYWSANGKKRISSINQIDSDVKDENGNVVLPYSLFLAGLVDVEGKPLKTTGAKIKGLVTGALALGGKVAGWAKDTALAGFKLLSNVGGRVGNFLTGKGEGLGIGGGGNKQTQVLVKIHNLLCRHFGYEDTIDVNDLNGPGAGALFSKAKDSVKDLWKKRPKFTKQQAKEKAEALYDDAIAQKDVWADKAKAKKDEVLADPRFVEARAKAELQLEKAKSKFRKKFGLSDDQSVFKSLTDRMGKLFARAMGKTDGDVDDKETIREMLRRKAGEMRDGSWKEQLAERMGKGKTAFKDKVKEKAEGSGILGKILMAVLGSGAVLKGMWESVKNVVSGIFGVRKAILAAQAVKAGADLADLGGGLPDGPDGPDKDKKGKPAKKKGWYRRGLGAAGRGAMALGRGAVTVASFGLGAVGVTAGGLWAGGAALLSGIGAVLTSPITLGVAAVAGAGYGAYKGYQFAKGSASLFERLRLAQYGLDPYANMQAYKVFQFEQGLAEFVKIDGKTAKLSDGINWEQWLEHFDVNVEDKDEVKAWTTWFNIRFKPVFLQWHSVVKSIDPTASFDDIDDDIPAEKKLEFARRTMFHRRDGNYPYDFATTWADGDWSIAPGTKIIDELLSEIVSKFKDAKAGTGNTVTTKSLGTGKTTVTAVALGNTTGVATPIKGLAKIGKESQFVAASERAGTPLDPKKSSLGNFTGGGGRIIDDFTALRLKTYGLTDLSISKVNAILALETEALLDVKVNADGTTEFKVSAEGYFKAFAANFEMSSEDVEHQEIWRVWFLNRFIPILLNYVAAIRKIDKNVSFGMVWKTLKPSELVLVADAIRNTKAEINGKAVSCWSINASPFPGFSVNMNSASVSAYYDGIKAKAKDDKYAEPLNKQAPVTFQTKDKDGKPVFNKLPNFGGPQPFQSPAMKQAQDPAVYKDMVSSNPTLKGGTASGGLYADIPEPTGDGTWDAVKNTIMKAAEVVGVDPGLMATMARIESGFRSKVKAKTSSATGLYQFLSSTWQDLMRRYAKTFGIPANAQPTDARASAILGGVFLKNNMGYLQDKLGREVNANDIYAAHFLGPAGAQKLLSSPPDTLADSVLPKAAASNLSVFYDNRRPKTVSEIYQWIDKKISGNSVIPRSDEADPSQAAMASNNGVVDDGTLGGGNVTAQSNKVGSEKSKPAGPAAPQLTSAYQNTIARSQASAAPAPTQTAGAASPSKQETQVVKAQQQQETQRRQQQQIQATLAKQSANQQVTQGKLLSESVDVQKSMDRNLDEILKAIKALAKSESFSVATTQKPQADSTAVQARRTTEAPKPPVSMSRQTA